MSSWKQSFGVACQELELAKKKRAALDDLLAKNRISQPTYEYLDGNFADSIRELEAHQKSLAGKMSHRSDELEKQGHLLELFLAYLEIRRAANEIEEETYVRRKEALTLGLDATSNELAQIRDALAKIGPQQAELFEAPQNI